ncbi:MAG: hypothetical protein KBA31_19940 [Alphaproteobacteria bacterium]|nr:hypothetical protein [Alphaproteobacteria bacterium]
MDHSGAIRDYFRCFAERDRAGLERLLAPSFRHVSPFGIHDDRDRMLDEIWPHVGRTWAADVQIFGSAPDFMVRYRHAGERSGSMAEWIRFDGEKIAEVEVFVGRT